MTNQIILTSEEHGCAYSIDSEGTLFYTPMFTDNKVDLEDWNDVEMDEIEAMGEDIVREILDIQDQLITMSKALGTYYQK